MLIALSLLAGLVLLYYGGEFLVRGGSSLAIRCGVSPLVIGLTLVAYATSAPELLVSVMAALGGNPNISIGNVVGSNICNIALILGLSAAIAPLAVEKKLLKFDLPFLLAVTLVFAAVGFFTRGVSRFVGALFFLGSVAYTVFTIAVARRAPAQEEACGEVPPKPLTWAFAIFFVCFGLGMLVGGSHLLVQGAVTLAKLLGVSDVVIGLTIVAVGTSMPELATSAVAAYRHESEIAIGNIVGSCIFNILCIMGIAPVIQPLVNVGVSCVDWGVFTLTALALYPMMKTGKTITRAEGIILLAFYALYLAYLVCAATGVF